MKKILIVDDSMFIRANLKDLFSRHGYEVIAEAVNGHEAVEKYKEHNPDIVTMDITMPVKNGIEASKEILEYDKSAKIIVMSALSQQKYIIESLRLGVKDFLFKPLNSELVISALNSL